MSGINDQIKSKLDRSKGITQAAIARYCGVSTSAVAQWIAGGGIDYKHIPKIAKFLEVSQKWLLTGEEDIQTYCSGEEEPPEGVIAVPEYELRFSAGGNGANEQEWEVVHSSRPVWYDKEEMRKLGIARPERCKRARVTGDSMEPTLYKNDTVLWQEEIDSRVGCVQIVDGCIYVISVGGTRKIKRLEKIKNGINVISDNSRYSQETYLNEECEQVRIYGRVYEVKRSL